MINYLKSWYQKGDTQAQSGRAHLSEWYHRALSGQRLREQVHADVAAILDEWFGYHMLVIGVDAGFDIASMTRVQHLSHILSAEQLSGQQRLAQQRTTSVIAEDEALPIESESVDVVVLINALELSEQPHQVLREAHRVLTPHGHLLVVGSNPNSLRGLWRRVVALTRAGRPLARGIATTQLNDWLTLLHFSVAPVRHKLLLPFAGSGRLGLWLNRVDNWLAEHNIPPGSSYVVYANKMVVGHISTQRTERVRARLMGLPVSKPIVGARGSTAIRNDSTPLRGVD